MEADRSPEMEDVFDDDDETPHPNRGDRTKRQMKRVRLQLEEDDEDSEGDSKRPSASKQYQLLAQRKTRVRKPFQ
jgi:hypothetical protein